MSSDASLRPPDPSQSAATRTGQVSGAELRSGDLLGSRFRIESLLGIGGMGVVYRARDLSLDIEIALKLLRPELARRPGAFERFRKELLLARQVSSPHVVRIHDIAEHEGRWFISMDFIDGESLEGYRDRVGKIPLVGALAITRGLLEGLTAAHQRGVIHRDLKPANVLLDKSGHAYITDFGVARSLGATGMTQSGIIVGTPEYLSPEQARGEQADARSDLYTTGLILYEMLTGSLPFSGGTPAETVIQRIVRAPPSLARARPDLPRWLHAFSDRLLKVNPSHRFASARDALRALDSKRVPRAPLNRRVLAAAIVVIAALGVGGVYFWRHPIPLRDILAPVVPATPRVAVLPFGAAPDDAELTALARAFEEHLREWLRTDAASAVISRSRVGDAIARTVPDLSGDAIVRQLPAIARAANASRVLRADVRRADGGLVLDLVWLDPDGDATPHSTSVKGVDAAALFAAYTAMLPASLRPIDLRVGTPPALSPSALPAFGRGLLALDKHQFEAAANELASIADSTPPSAIVDLALLSAQEDAHQDLPAQNTRDAALTRFAQDRSPAAMSLRARAQTETNESDAALAGLDQAIKAFPHDPQLVLQNAEALAANGKGAEAMTALKSFVETDDQDARAWFLLGRTAIMQGQAQAAADEYLIRAVTLNRRARDNAAEAETHNAIGAAFDQLGQLESAATEYALAATMREKLGDAGGQAKSLRNLAIVQAMKGVRAAAEQTLDKVKGLLESLGDRASVADLYNDRGVVAEEQGDFSAALAAYREALAIRQQLNEPALIAESYNNVGFAAFQLGQLDNALAFWQQAESLYKQLDDVGRALRIEQSMGLLDMARGHFDAARERLQSSLRDAENHQLPEEAAVGSLNLAELALVEGRYKDSLEGAQRALDMFTRSSLLRGQIEANLLLARIELELGDAAKADAALSAVPAEDISNEQRAIFLLASARSAYLANDRVAGAAKLQEAEKVASDAHAGVVAFRVMLEKSRQQLAAGDTANALKTLAALRADTTLLGQVPLRAELIELEIAALARSDQKRDATTRYREALPLLRDMGRFAHASALHEVGARAFAPDSADARAALAAAATARQQLIADAPADSQASLERQLALRLRQETGATDAR
jgi:tetratricopeptide (TPR) repeat protein